MIHLIARIKFHFVILYIQFTYSVLWIYNNAYIAYISYEFKYTFIFEYMLNIPQGQDVVIYIYIYTIGTLKFTICEIFYYITIYSFQNYLLFKLYEC